MYFMEKLNYLAAYLPHNVTVFGKEELPFYDEDDKLWKRYTYPLAVETIRSALKENEKLILRPLSDLFIKRFDNKNGGLRHIDIISSKIFFDNYIDSETTHQSFWHNLINSSIYPTLSQANELLTFLYKNHYDVEALFNYGSGLIEKGLAIDINTLDL